MKKSIRFRLILFFAIILCIFGMSNIWAIFNFNTLSRSIDSIMESNYRSIESAQNMMVAIERQDSAILGYMFSENEETISSFYDNQKIFLNWLTRAEDNITENGETDVIEAINRSYDQYINLYANFIALGPQKNSNEMNDYYYNQLFTAFESTKESCRELLNLNQTSMLERKNSAQKIAQKATISTAIVSTIALLLGILIVTILSNRIVNPIKKLIDKIKEISDGHYNQQIEIEGQDEISQLALEFNTMAKRLVDYDKLNISRLLEEKNKSEAIVSSIGDGIIVVDQDNRITLVNQKAEMIFGIHEKDVLKRHLLEAVNNETLFSLFKKMNDAPYERQRKKNAEIAVETQKDLSYYNVNVRPVQTSENRHLGVVALIQDITKIKEVDRLKSDFISTVSHEFRTPLTSITMGVGLLLEQIPGTLTAKQKELVEAIKEDSERLNKLVGELLDLSKLESGKMQMDFQSHQLKETINYSMEVFKIQFEEINADLVSNLPKKMKLSKMDLNKIAWVLTNLIGNALRYLPKDGTGKVEVGAKELYGKTLVWVKDNGAGINDSIKAHIFDKFIQGKEKAGGAGLGLAICQEIIKAHGGDIWVESEVDKGTTFYFTVPMIQKEGDI